MNQVGFYPRDSRIPAADFCVEPAHSASWKRSIQFDSAPAVEVISEGNTDADWAAWDAAVRQQDRSQS